MSVNSMQFEQAAGLLNTIYADATGGTAPSTTIRNMGDYVSIGQTLLQMGKDPILRAINQMFTKTIIGVRPYSEILPGLEVDNTRFGSITRKLNWLDKRLQDNYAWPLSGDLSDAPTPHVDGQSIDPYVINKDAVVQTNFYGADTYADSRTIYDYQLESAFTSPGGMGQFFAGSALAMANKLSQVRENWKRVALINLIAGRAAEGDTNMYINVLSAYKTATGNSTITTANWQSADEIKDFIPWLYGYLNTLLGLLRNRSTLFHTGVPAPGSETGVNSNRIVGLMRQTAPKDAKVYVAASVANQIDSQVMPATYHNNLLKFADYEKIDYWQDITNPLAITATPTYLNGSTGNLVTAESELTLTNIIGVIFDRDACGISVFNEGTYNTPYNARGSYYNQWFHETGRIWNDFTENSIVLYMAD